MNRMCDVDAVFDAAGKGVLADAIALTSEGSAATERRRS